MRKIKKNYKKMIEEFMKINKEIILDLIISLYDEKSIEADFRPYMRSYNYSNRENFAILPIIYDEIINKKEKYEEFLELIFSRNNTYIRNNGFHDISIEKLEKEFQRELLPAHHKQGIAPEMMIAYYYSRNIFNNEIIEISKKKYVQTLEKVKERGPVYVPQEIEIETKLKQISDEINFFLNEKEIKDFEKNDFKQISEKMHCEYDEDTHTYNNVKRGVIVYLYAKLDTLFEDLGYNQALLTSLKKGVVRMNIVGENQAALLKELFENKEKRINEERKNKNLSKEVSELRKIIAKKDDNNTENKEKEIQKLNSENYYLKTRIDKLEEQIALLEEEKKINTTIEENIVIEKEKIIEFQKEIPEFSNIIILGGRWNSKLKEEIEKYFENNEVEFIEAEKTIRNFDRISNADIVIFDTSYNSHAYYMKIKPFVKKLYHISKSNLSNIENIFE